ncbi:hypothetical protein [Salinibaculum rarum]|nr:hypothetical protein [Salinibaculum sp. KK48]
MTVSELQHIHRVSLTDENGDELTPAEQDARITNAIRDRFY